MRKSGGKNQIAQEIEEKVQTSFHNSLNACDSTYKSQHARLEPTTKQSQTLVMGITKTSHSNTQTKPSSTALLFGVIQQVSHAADFTLTTLVNAR